MYACAERALRMGLFYGADIGASRMRRVDRVVENFFSYRERRHHEVGTYFKWTAGERGR
jgi:hypothetical protein